MKDATNTAVCLCTLDGKPVADSCASQGVLLRRLYTTAPGRACLKVLTAPICSYVVGCAMDHPLSTLAIPSFVKKHAIDLSDYTDKVYRSFNDFFTRQIKPAARPIDAAPEALIAPCDGKLTVAHINEDTTFSIKGSVYRLPELLGCKRLAKCFLGGECLIFRLTPDDYHRYCYPDACHASAARHLPGVLHTVHPVAVSTVPVYHQNARAVTLLQTAHFGAMLQLEVGAMLVGKIINHIQPCYPHKGTEKGFFAFGGSTVILITSPNRVAISPQLLRNSNAGCETIVRFGMRIGMALPNPLR